MSKSTPYTCGVFLVDRSGRLLACHPTDAPRHGNFWSIPKGLPDDGETHVVAAARELMEETGFELDPEKLVDLGEIKYASGKKKLHAFMAILAKTRDKLSEPYCHSHFERGEHLIPEVDDFEWVTPDTAELVLHESQCRMLPKVIKILKHNNINYKQ